ncbi:MAG: malonyl-CoA decarboxylase [Cytophagales bacterium]|nr:malonyl-CoA decarboxylase [Cytophagales bacterium]
MTETPKKSWIGRLLKATQSRQLFADLQAIVEPRISQTEAGLRAVKIIDWYATAPEAHRVDLCLLMSEKFAPDIEGLRVAKEHYEQSLSTSEQGMAEIKLRRALISPRRRLLQSFAAHPLGIRFLVDLRAQLLGWLAHEPRLRTLDAELEALFTAWFDVAFLELKRITWDSPASLLEKLIQYEAVHDIKSWDDLKNRLDADRRCYGFFHPRLPSEPLIFVEVAFANKFEDPVTTGMEPLLDVAAAPTDLSKVSTAIFYSISNTQSGLKGVSFGDSLIKLVVETLKAEYPQLKTFTTLSPIPGLTQWLKREDEGLALALQALSIKSLSEKDVLRRRLQSAAAKYLARGLAEQRPIDPVARFHLGNGARIERLNWAADLSRRGLAQSFGLMVNYLYDLKSLAKNRALLTNGRIAASKAVTRWL